jgi:hypothetical protein
VLGRLEVDAGLSAFMIGAHMKIPKSMTMMSENIVDLRQPAKIEITINANGSTLWVNVDGICRLRIYDIKDCEFEITTRLAGYVKT